MNKIKFLIYLLVLFGIISIAYYSYKRVKNRQKTEQLYKTETPQTKTLYQNLSSAGILELKETYKIGSQVPGVIQDVFVKENELVKKGQKLAIIELVKGDTDVRIAKANLDKAQKEFDYQKEYFDRQRQLYKSNQLSKNAFQRIETDYLKSKDDLDAVKVALEKAALEIKNSQVVAPADGIVIKVDASKGAAVLNDYQNILFELAEDISEMKAVLDIDESEVGQVKIGLKAKIIINSYPDILIKNAISEVSFVPKNGSATSTQAFYKATVNLSNKERVLRPGMRLNAQIRISKVKDALSINSMAFQVDADILKKIAEKINFTCIVLDKKQKKEFRRSNQQKGVRFVWVKEGSGFVEKGIVVGITDEAYWQVVSGLSATDKVIVDVQEPNVMDEMYSKWFKGSL